MDKDEPVGGETLPNDAAQPDQTAETSVTQPMPVSAEAGETGADYPSNRPAEPALSEVEAQAALGETQPSISGDDGLNLPPEIPDLPPENPKRRANVDFMGFPGSAAAGIDCRRQWICRI